MRKKFSIGLIIGLLIALMAIPCYAGQATILSDEDLDKVSAGGLPEIHYEIIRVCSGELGDYLGGLEQGGYDNYGLSNGGTVFTLGSQSQQSFQALANINAINSAVAYLVNITIINGPNFGEITQTNNAVVSNRVF